MWKQLAAVMLIGITFGCVEQGTITQDITDQKRAEEALAEIEANQPERGPILRAERHDGPLDGGGQRRSGARRRGKAQLVILAPSQGHLPRRTAAGRASPWPIPCRPTRAATSRDKHRAAFGSGEGACCFMGVRA